MLHLSRRYNKSFAPNPTDRGDDSGFTRFGQVIAEIDGLLNVVWISATIEIQIPYLLALAGNFRGFMHSFDFDTDSFFLARKFDQAFSQLLTTAQPNSSTAHTIDKTEKVRIRSLAEETRFEMVDVASRNGYDTSRTAGDADEDDDYDLETDASQPSDTQSPSQSIALNLGKVYEKTLEILGGDVTSLPPLTSKRDPSTPQITDDVEIIDL